MSLRIRGSTGQISAECRCLKGTDGSPFYLIGVFVPNKVSNKNENFIHDNFWKSCLNGSFSRRKDISLESLRIRYARLRGDGPQGEVGFPDSKGHG